MAKLRDLFLEHIRTERRLSERTVDTYDECLKLFESYILSLDDSRELHNADSDNIRDWMEQLMDRGRSAVYVNKCLAALRTFYKFCLSHNLLEKDPAHSVVGPKKERRLPTFIREKEMDKLLDLLSVDENSDVELVRTRTIIYMLYATGLRSAELISLDDSMIDFCSSEIRVVGKRDKQRIVPFGEELKKELMAYVKKREEQIPDRCEAFFVTNKGARMSYAQVRKIVKDNLTLVTTAKKRSPHVLRHTFATSMLNHEANLESIRKLLGHESLETTEIYTHTSFEKLKEVYNEAHPRA